MTIDGTDMPVEMRYDEEYFSHKFKGRGLRYEVGVCIQTGDIVWINGPFPCGKRSDLGIARQGVIGALKEGERVEADAGYEGEAYRINTPNDYMPKDVVAMKKGPHKDMKL